MQKTINTIATIPKNWKPNNFNEFCNWYKYKVKSRLMIDEDYGILKNWNNAE